MDLAMTDFLVLGGAGGAGGAGVVVAAGLDLSYLLSSPKGSNSSSFLVYLLAAFLSSGF
jgi:hypothetical protein